MAGKDQVAQGGKIMPIRTHSPRQSAAPIPGTRQRAREHIALAVASKDDLARSIGHHRGEVANARELFNEGKPGKDRGASVGGMGQHYHSSQNGSVPPVIPPRCLIS